jgi:ribosomal protein S18 acetylase RimI-like enzyme
MIRPTVPADVPRLVELTAATGLFRPEEIVALGEVFDDYFSIELLAGDAATHCCFTSEQNGQIIGYVYLAEAEMSDRAWYVWWIAVDPTIHKRGVGRALMHYAEDEARRRGGRVMFVETSGIAEYESTRKFYLKNGYDQEAVLRDYYRDGDDMVVFRKRLTP